MNERMNGRAGWFDSVISFSMAGLGSGPSFSPGASGMGGWMDG